MIDHSGLDILFKEYDTNTSGSRIGWMIEITGAFAAWWQTLRTQGQDDATAIVEILEERGPSLPHLYSSGVLGSSIPHLRELRIQSSGTPILRVFYAFDPRPVAVLLIGGVKRGKKDRRSYKTLTARVEAIYRAPLHNLRGTQG